MVKNKYQIEVGRAYKWKTTGPTFLCIDFDLETFTGICIDPGLIDKRKLGSIHKDLNADATEWYRLSGKIKLEDPETVLMCTTFAPGKKPKTEILK